MMNVWARAANRARAGSGLLEASRTPAQCIPINWNSICLALRSRVLVDTGSKFADA
ncbi:hypothetical protein I549_3414 [Mycobacterium avium subsp. avium 2285 (R)]|nr:hypothetical protein I549_3414 [Mycobacterium avium subsp. avium 2285 (R)]